MRKGFLSDKSIIEHCIEYQSVPFKAVMPVLKVQKAENDYTGIKQIYRKSPPRPVNINALATSLSQMGKNKQMPFSVVYRSVEEAIVDDIESVRDFSRPTADLVGFSRYDSWLLRGGIGEQMGIEEKMWNLIEPEEEKASFDVLTRDPVEKIESPEDFKSLFYKYSIEEINPEKQRGGSRVGAGKYGKETIIQGIKFDTPAKEIRKLEREREERIKQMTLSGEVLSPVLTRRFKSNLIGDTPTGVLSGFPSSQPSGDSTPI